MNIRVLVFIVGICFGHRIAPCQWVQKAIPSGGQLYGFAEMGNNLFAYGQGGVFLSTDNGNNWSLVWDHFEVTTLSVRDTILFAGTSDLGVLITIDSGRSWVQLNVGESTIQSITTSGKYILVGTTTDVYFSNDGGSIFQKEGMGGTAGQAFVMTGETFVVTTVGDGVYISTNSGSTWDYVSISYSYLYDVCHNNKFLYAIDNNGNIYISRNTGASWKITNITQDNTNALITNSDYLYVGTKNGLLIRCSSNLSRCDTIRTGLSTIAHLFIHANSIFITSGGDSVFRSDDSGKTWILANTGLVNPGRNIHALIMDKNNLYAGTDNGVFRSTDFGSHWVSGGLRNQNIHTLTMLGSKLFVGTDIGMFESIDSGSTCASIDESLGTNDIHSATTFQSKIYAGYSNLLEYSDSEKIWTKSGCPCGLVFSLAENLQSLFVGSLEGFFHFTNGSWKGPTFSESIVYSIAATKNSVFIGTDSGVYVSKDNGDHWLKSQMHLPVHALVAAGTHIFASVSNGEMFQIDENESNWIPITDNLPAGYINSLFVQDSFLFAGSTVASVWRRSFPELGVVSSQDKLSPTAILKQNYPNPFDAKTRISFLIRFRDFVTIKVCDVLGNTIATLTKQYYDRGSYNLEWDASTFPSGIYYYQLQTGHSVETKLLIVRR